MNQDKRFEVVYKQGTFEVYRIIVDKETGVQYLSVGSGNSSGLTVLVDREGKPIVSKGDYSY